MSCPTCWGHGVVGRNGRMVDCPRCKPGVENAAAVVGMVAAAILILWMLLVSGSAAAMQPSLVIPLRRPEPVAKKDESRKYRDALIAIQKRQLKREKVALCEAYLELLKDEAEHDPDSFDMDHLRWKGTLSYLCNMGTVANPHVTNLCKSALVRCKP